MTKPLYFQDHPLFFCRSGTLVDVGCNEGFHLAQFMMFEGDKRIVAYEPKRQLAVSLMLQVYQRHNGSWPNDLEIYHLALGNHHGRLKLHTPKIGGNLRMGWSSVMNGTFDLGVAQAHYGDQFEVEEEYVQISTLDSQGLDNVTFLKIDVEGAEEEVLRGGLELINRCRPVINIELVEYMRPGCIAAVQRLLEDLGYQGFFMHGDNQVFPMAHFRQELHQISKFDGFCVTEKQEPYIWEFQFIHRDDAWAMNQLTEIYGPVQDYVPPSSVR